jgi:hypothetical protein
MTRCCFVHCPKHGTCGRRGAAGHCKDGCHALMSLAEQGRLEEAFFAPEEPTFTVFLGVVCNGCENYIHSAVWHCAGTDYCTGCWRDVSDVIRPLYNKYTTRNPYEQGSVAQMTAAEIAARARV